MSEYNNFSVIVPALNEEQYIGKCLESLKRQDYKGLYEIIVVDNGSADKTVEICQRYGVTVLREPEKGISKVLIKGCQKANGSILMFTDADTILPADWLIKYNEHFNLHHEAVAIGGLYLFYDNRFLAKVVFNKILKPILLFILERFIQPAYPTLACANMAVRRDNYEKVGGFNRQLQWGQEIDLVKRLAKQGKIIFDRNLVVQTSFRRYSGEQDNGLVAFCRSIKELVVTIYRGLAMHMKHKQFTAQDEVRKNSF